MLILSLCIHEVAHGWVALKCGDTTARDLGRLTLNPLPHIDPFMTILLPLILFMTAGFAFGGAKPVPVNPYRLRRPLRDMALVAIAGPLSNVLLAVLFTLLHKLAVDFGGYDSRQLLPQVLDASALFNLVLAVFNMIPVPPLDGSRVLAWLLPKSIRGTYVGLERYGMLIVFGLLMLGAFDTLVFSAILPLDQLVQNLVSLGGAW